MIVKDVRITKFDIAATSSGSIMLTATPAKYHLSAVDKYNGKFNGKAIRAAERKDKKIECGAATTKERERSEKSAHTIFI